MNSSYFVCIQIIANDIKNIIRANFSFEIEDDEVL